MFRPLSGRKSPERFLLIIADVVLDLTYIIDPAGAVVNTNMIRMPQLDVRYPRPANGESAAPMISEAASGRWSG